MRCEEFEARWNEWLDEHSLPEFDAELRQHVQRCRSCGELLRGHEVFVRALETAPCVEPGPDFAARVVAKVGPVRVRTASTFGASSKPLSAAAVQKQSSLKTAITFAREKRLPLFTALAVAALVVAFVPLSNDAPEPPIQKPEQTAGSQPPSTDPQPVPENSLIAETTLPDASAIDEPERFATRVRETRNRVNSVFSALRGRGQVSGDGGWYEPVTAGLKLRPLAAAVDVLLDSFPESRDTSS